MKNRLHTVKRTDLDAINSTLPSPSDNLSGIWGLISFISLVAFLLLSTLAYAQDSTTDHFVLKITTTAGTTASDVDFTFHTEDTNYDIDWDNDGTFEDIGVSGNQPHTFATAGEHTIRFRNLNDIYINDQTGREKYTSIEQWGMAVWNADMSGAFWGASNLTMKSNAGTPDMSAVTNMRNMFFVAKAFNGNISEWNTASVTNMRNMFYSAIKFNGDISGWNTSAVTNMSYMFNNATVFNQNIRGWNIEGVMTMQNMFSRTTAFNQNIGNWNTSAVMDMSYMFDNATAFNQDISGWNTASVENMEHMFQGTTSFNQSIGGWNTAQVMTMRNMFGEATAFDQNIRNWNTSAVTNMSFMFNNATAFNQDISGWNTSAVTSMRSMFEKATAFDQNIGGWDVGKVMNMTEMFSDVTLSIANYDALLTGWNAQTLRSSVTFDGGNSLYMSADAQTARANMISSDSWTITDGGLRTMNEAPTNIFLSSTSIEENAGANAVVGMLSNTDIGGTYTYTLVRGSGDTHNSSFNISGTSLRLTASADKEARFRYFSYSIRINVNDGTHNFEKKFRISLEDVNEAPTATANGTPFMVAENSTNGTDIGTVTATDPDSPRSDNGTLTYAITDGNTGDVFAIDPSTGEITVAGTLDYETSPSYSLMVTATDGGSTPLHATAMLTITVTDVNDAPVFAGGVVATVSYAENATTVVTTVAATDDDTGQTLTLMLSGADEGLFSITPAGVLTFKTAPDFEIPTDTGSDNVYVVTITATDDGIPVEMATQTLTITVTDVNDNAPVFAGGTTMVDVTEGTTAVTTVAATDADAGQAVTLMLSGADAGLFSITPAGVLTFNTAPDFEMPTDTGADNVYEVTITATDNGTPEMTATQALTITVTDVTNEHTPVFAGGATVAVSYAENDTTAVITVVATDGDTRQTITLMLSGADAGLFSITPAGVLTFNTAPDFEMPTDTRADNVYEVTITATDNGTPEMTVEQALTITVTDEDEQHANNAPVFAGGVVATVSYAENATTVVTTVAATDDDTGQTLTLMLSGADEGLFTLTPAGALTFNTAPDFEMPTDVGGNNVYVVTITATDDGMPVEMATQTLTITVTDVNDNAPVFAGGTTMVDVTEGTTAVTTVAATDADAGQAVTFLTTLSGADAGLFSITPAGVLTFNTAPDFEMPTDTGADNVYEVTITATDNGTPEMTATQALTITVTELTNEHVPVFTSEATVTYAENTTTAVTTVTAMDADAGQTVRFTLTGGDDIGLFTITTTGALAFKTAPNFEMPMDMGGNNVYEVTITATDDGTPVMTATQTLTITVTDVSENNANAHPPIFADGATATIAYAENATTAVTTVVAMDADEGQMVALSLSGGDDESKFSLTPAGVLTFNTAPDFEMPTDTGADNVYEVTITATDNGTPEMTATQALTITVTDVVDGDGGVTLGLEAFTDIEVYPNPAGAVLHISGVAGNARYTLSGMDGKVLKRGKLKAGTADHSVAMPSLNKGIYVLQLTTGKGGVTRKIVKE